MIDYKNKIICGDCIEIMQKLPHNCIDLVVTSPPYNINIKYDNYNDDLIWDKYYFWCKKWMKEINRILKDDGRACIIHYLSYGNSQNRQMPIMELNNIAIKEGLKHYGLAIWWDITLCKKTAWGSWLSASQPYINSPLEGILILYKNKIKKEKEGKTQINKGEFMESCGGIWKIKPENNKNIEHPAPFPIELASRCIKLLSWENDIVLDPFIGSGTTAIAAKLLNRNYIGMDISHKYCNIARKRLLQDDLTTYCD